MFTPAFFLNTIFEICNDNTIYTIGYGGVSTTVYTSYVMNDSADGVYVKDLFAYDAAGLSIDEPDYVGNSYEDDRFWFYSTSEDYWDDGINTTYSEAQAFIEEQESKIITLDTIPLSTYKNEMVMDSFYGIWCYRSKNMEDAVDFMNNYDVGYILPQMFLTTDWENLNSEPYYVVTIGVYRTQEKAENELSRVQEQYPDAYIEYSGKYIGE